MEKPSGPSWQDIKDRYKIGLTQQEMPLKLKVVALCNENQAFMQYKTQGLFEGKRQRSTSPKPNSRSAQKESFLAKAAIKSQSVTPGMKTQRSPDGRQYVEVKSGKSNKTRLEPLRNLKFHNKQSNASGDDLPIFRNTSSHKRSRSRKSNTISHPSRSPQPPHVISKNHVTFQNAKNAPLNTRRSDEKNTERNFEFRGAAASRTTDGKDHSSIFPPIS